jgi:hypothetical protein
MLQPETVEQCRNVHVRLPDAVTAAFTVPQILVSANAHRSFVRASLDNRLLVYEHYAGRYAERDANLSSLYS